jgi:hypothetical protein
MPATVAARAAGAGIPAALGAEPGWAATVAGAVGAAAVRLRDATALPDEAAVLAGVVAFVPGEVVVPPGEVPVPPGGVAPVPPGEGARE